MKRVQKLIVGENYVLADRPALGGVAANNWVAGKINILKEDYTAYDAAGADAAYDGKIAILRFDNERNVYMTEFISKSEVKAVSIQAYQAPVLERTDVDLSAISAVAGEAVGVEVINTTNRELIYTGRRQYIVTSSGTLTTDIDAVAAAINADPFNDATAARSGNVLQITAAAFDPEEHISEPKLSVRTVESWSAVSPTIGVAAVAGIGTPDKVGLIESLEDFGTQGVLNFREFPVVPDSVVQSASTYNLVVLEYGSDWGGTTGVPVGAKAPKAIITAMNSGGTGAAAFTTALQTWLNVKIDNLEGA